MGFLGDICRPSACRDGRSSGLHFDLSRVLPNIVAPLKSSAADGELTGNIRQALVELHRTVFLLQGVITEAACQVEENNDSGSQEIEDRGIEQASELHLSPSRALSSSAPTPAGDPGTGERTMERRGDFANGELLLLERLYSRY